MLYNANGTLEGTPQEMAAFLRGQNEKPGEKTKRSYKKTDSESRKATCPVCNKTFLRKFPNQKTCKNNLCKRAQLSRSMKAMWMRRTPEDRHVIGSKTATARANNKTKVAEQN